MGKKARALEALVARKEEMVRRTPVQTQGNFCDEGNLVSVYHAKGEVDRVISTVWAVVREGKVVPLEKIEVSEGTRALVTLLPDETEKFWLRTSESALDSVWDNAEDDCYAQLLEK